MRIFLLLPAYNEADNISTLLTKVLSLEQSLPKKYSVNIIVINDGSSDDTVARVKNFYGLTSLRIISHEHNKGLGGALRTGLKTISSVIEPNDVMATMDADNTHDPLLIISMIKKIEKGADVVIASRYQSGGQEKGVPLLRIFLSRLGNMAFRILFHVPHVRDYSSGFRMIRGSILINLDRETNGSFFKKNGFACMTEFLLNLSSFTCRFSEVPLVLRYDFKKGPSKMIPGKTIMEYLSLIVYKIRK